MRAVKSCWWVIRTSPSRQGVFRFSGCAGFGLVSFLFSGGRVRDGGTGVPVVIAVAGDRLVKVVTALAGILASLTNIRSDRG